MVTPSPATYGLSVTLNAAVTSGATGNVTFYDDQMILGIGLVVDDSAAITSILLSTGAHTLYARYNGDSFYAPSMSDGISEVVVTLPGNGFQSPMIFSTGFNASPTSVGIGDFNGDGKPDLAIPNFTYPGYNENSVTVRLNNGDGTFRTGQTYTAAIWPSDVLVCDFNGDGQPDLLALGVGNGFTSTVLLGNGDGTFQPLANPVLGGRAAVVSDFNDDGIADLLVIGPTTNAYAVQLGTGDGTFQAPVYHPAAGSPWAVAVGDFDNDGNTDIVIGYHDGGLTVELGNGDGSFQPWTYYSTPGGAYSVVVGDFDGDGRQDLAVAIPNYSPDPGYVAVLPGNGDGTFQSPVTTTVAGGVNSLAMADFNGDGILDLAIGNIIFASNSAGVLLGKGDGSFQSPVYYPLPTFAPGVKAFDANADGVADLVIASNGGYNPQDTGAVYVLLGNAAAPVPSAQPKRPR